MHKTWEEAYILHTRSFSDTSIIAEVFTRYHGRVSVLAKGAKNPKSKFFGYLIPFKFLRIITSGKSDLKTLNEVDTNQATLYEQSSHSVYSHLYINELIIKILPKDLPNIELFNLYHQFIQTFNSSEFQETSLREFELDLLDVLGFGINFDTDSKDNKKFEDDQKYHFVVEKGFYPTNDIDGFTSLEIKNIQGRNLLAVDKVKLKSLTQTAIQACLDGKDLLSRDIFRSVKS